jgi:hypothetical protein
VARYIVSAPTGLGFYHIEAPIIHVNHVASTRNYGVVVVDEGSISKEDLAKDFANIYNTNWPWQIKELGDWSFLVKFPPHIQVGTCHWLSHIWSDKSGCDECIFRVFLLLHFVQITLCSDRILAF